MMKYSRQKPGPEEPKRITRSQSNNSNIDCISKDALQSNLIHRRRRRRTPAVDPTSQHNYECGSADLKTFIKLEPLEVNDDSDCQTETILSSISSRPDLGTATIDETPLFEELLKKDEHKDTPGSIRLKTITELKPSELNDYPERETKDPFSSTPPGSDFIVPAPDANARLIEDLINTEQHKAKCQSDKLETIMKSIPLGINNESNCQTEDLLSLIPSRTDLITAVPGADLQTIEEEQIKKIKKSRRSRKSKEIIESIPLEINNDLEYQSAEVLPLPLSANDLKTVTTNTNVRTFETEKPEIQKHSKRNTKVIKSKTFYSNKVLDRDNKAAVGLSRAENILLPATTAVNSQLSCKPGSLGPSRTLQNNTNFEKKKTSSSTDSWLEFDFLFKAQKLNRTLSKSEDISLPSGTLTKNAGCALDTTGKTLSTQLQSDSVTKPKIHIKRNLGRKISKKLIESDVVQQDHNLETETSYSSSKSSLFVDSIFQKCKRNKSRTYESTQTPVKNIVKYDPMDLSNDYEIDFTSGKTMPKTVLSSMPKRGMRKTTSHGRGCRRSRSRISSIKSKSSEQNDYDFNTTNPPPGIEVVDSESILEMDRSKSQLLRKSKSRTPESLIHSNLTLINDNDVRQSRDSSCDSLSEINSLFKTPQSYKKPTVTPGFTSVKISSTLEPLGKHSEHDCGTKHATLSTKANLVVTPRGASSVILRNSEPLKTENDTVSEAKNTFAQSHDYMKRTSDTVKNKISLSRKSISNARRKRKKSDSIETAKNNEVYCPTRNVSSETYMNLETNAETMQPQISFTGENPNGKHKPSKLKTMNILNHSTRGDYLGDHTKTDSGVATATTNLVTDKNKDIVTENTFYNISKNKHTFLDPRYQPKVLLWNIAYSNKISPKQREFLFQNEQKFSSNVKNEPSVTPDVTVKPQKLLKTNIKDCSSMQPNIKRTKSQRNGVVTAQTKHGTSQSLQPAWSEPMHSVQTNTTPNKTFGLYSLVNSDVKSQQKFDSSTRLLSENANLPKSGDVKIRKLKEHLVKKLSSVRPLTSSIRHSIQSTREHFDPLNHKNISNTELCCNIIKNSPQNVNISNVELGKDVSTSFTEVSDRVDVQQCQKINKPGKKLKVSRKDTIHEHENRYKTSPFYSALNCGENDLPTTTVGSNYARKTTSATPTKLSFKISIPAEHCLDNLVAVSKKENKVVNSVELAPTTRPHDQVNKRITNTLSYRAFNVIDFGETAQTATGENCKPVELIAPTEMCRLDDVDAYFAKASQKAVSETDLPGIPKKQLKLNNRSLPIIITDELLPKGTITLPAFNDKFKSSNKFVCDNLNNIEGSTLIFIPTEGIQSTVNSAPNISQWPTNTDNRTEAKTSNCESIDVNNYIGVNKNVETQISFCNQTTEQSGIGDTTFQEKLNIEVTDEISGILTQPFDSTMLWEICPELATFFVDDDVVNNNENKPSNIDSLPTATDDNYALQPDNIAYYDSNANNLQNVFEDVAALNDDHIEMQKQSPKRVDADNECVPQNLKIADLTIANLKDFTNRTDNDEFKWCVETCQYYSPQKKVRKHNDSGTIGEGCQATNHSRGKDACFQEQSRQRKRKWNEAKKNLDSETDKAKRFKLNRSKPKSLGEQAEHKASDFAMANSIQSNGCIIASNLNRGYTTSPKKTYNERIVTVQNVINRNIRAEEQTRTTQIEDNTKIVNCDGANEKVDIKIATTKCELSNNLQDVHVNSLTPKAEHDDCLSSIDDNGNLKSSSSSSSSSTQSSDSISSSESTSQLENLNSERIPKDENQSFDEVNHPEEEELDYEVDDCISIFAKSDFTNFFQETDFVPAANISTKRDTTKVSDEKFQEITDVGTYFAKNVQECNEAYESCVESRNVSNNSHVASQTHPETHTLQSNLCKSVTCTKTPMENASCSQTVVPKTSSNPPKLKDRLGSKVATPKYSPHSSRNHFQWHCYKKLRWGICTVAHCRYYHDLAPDLANLNLKDPGFVSEVMNCAVYNGYGYFIQYAYPQVIVNMNVDDMLELFSKLNNNYQMTEFIMKCTVNRLIETGMSSCAVVSAIVNQLAETDNITARLLLTAIGYPTQPGTYWNTFRDLFIKVQSLDFTTDTIIYECINTQKDRAHIEDVYVNYIKKLTVEQISNININLRKQFECLLVANDLVGPQYRSMSMIGSLDVNPTLERNTAQNSDQRAIKRPCILTHDATVQCKSTILTSDECIQVNLQSSPQRTFDIPPSTRSQNSSLKNVPSIHNSLNQNRSYASQIDSPANSVDSNTWRSKVGSLSPSGSSFTLHQIDNLNAPQSVFRERHWDFYLDEKILKEALEDQDYEHVLRTMNKYSDMDQTIFTSSCYKMLRKNVMKSAYHVKNMIQLSVRMRVSKFLRETLFTLGMYTMIELCDANAWVLAYSLFKCLQYSGLSENIAAFVLISAEICLANRRPLKAFTILKQNNMLCANRDKWNVVSTADDEHVRVMIINLLLENLCQQFPEQAFYTFTYLLRDQTHIYHPIDLTAYVDQLVISILNEKSNDSAIEIGRLIVESNFTLKKSVFQSLIANVFERDLELCKQLYRYGTWIGMYSLIELTVPLHVLIKTNWGREEMYLAITDFLEKLAMEMGHAIDHIGPNQFSIHLVFELAPFHQPASNGNIGISNKDELKLSKQLMRNVLQEQFNPPLKANVTERERFLKLQSRSVVDYLKSMKEYR